MHILTRQRCTALNCDRTSCVGPRTEGSKLKRYAGRVRCCAWWVSL